MSGTEDTATTRHVHIVVEGELLEKLQLLCDRLSNSWRKSNLTEAVRFAVVEGIDTALAAMEPGDEEDDEDGA
jgi:hypothetical protein